MNSASSCFVFNVEEDGVVIRNGWTPKKPHAERILNIFEIDYEIHISMLFSSKLGGISLVLFNIKPL